MTCLLRLLQGTLGESAFRSGSKWFHTKVRLRLQPSGKSLFGGPRIAEVSAKYPLDGFRDTSASGIPHAREHMRVFARADPRSGA